MFIIFKLKIRMLIKLMTKQESNCPVNKKDIREILDKLTKNKFN